MQRPLNFYRRDADPEQAAGRPTGHTDFNLTIDAYAGIEFFPIDPPGF